MPPTRTLKDLPMMAGGGLFGHADLMRKDRLAFLDQMARAPDLCRLRFFNAEVALATDPALVQEILIDHARAFEKSTVLRYLLYPLAGEGLFTSRGALWRRQRRLMAPLFQPGQMGRYAADMVACALRSVATLQDHETRDMARETTRITMAIAGKTLFDADTFSEADELGAALTTALEWVGTQTGSLLPVVQAQVSTGLARLAEHLPQSPGGAVRGLAERLERPVLLWGKRDQQMLAAIAVLERRVQRMIDERRSGGLQQQDLLTRLLQARDEDDGETMSDRQVRDEVLTLFVAGHETTATALAWALYLLARHPQAGARAQAEADALGRPPCAEDLPRLSYLSRVFKESLRLYPPVAAFSRESTSEVTIGDCRFPAGSFLFLSPYATHRRPDLWPDPERFDPDRFLPAAEEQRPRLAFFPFSSGPRVCIGNHFALMEGPLVLAALLQRASFQLASPDPILPDPSGATLRPSGGVPMRVRLRASASGRS